LQRLLLLQVPVEQKRPSQHGSPAPPQCVQVLFEHAFDAEQKLPPRPSQQRWPEPPQATQVPLLSTV
jgi:hypothetical protein